VGSVLFPSLSEIRGEPARTRSLFLRALDAVALVSFPLNLGLVAVMDLAVPVVLGAAWTPMVPLARIFCAVGLVQSLAVLNGSLYLSQGRTDLQLRWGLLFRSVAIAAIVVGLRWGVLGVACGYALATLATWYPNTRIATGLVGLHVRSIVRRLAPVLACAGGMAVAVWALGRALEPHAPPALRLAAQLAAGPLLYVGLLTLVRVRAAAEMLAALRRQLGESRGDAATIPVAAPRDTAG
jgi:PST family polysaccharide transporter